LTANEPLVPASNSTTPASTDAISDRVGPSLPSRTRSKPTAADPTAQLRNLVVDKLEGMKARDLCLIDVRGRTDVTDFLVIASGTSTRHVKAMAQDVVEAAKAADLPPLGLEGEREAEWVLVDLGDVVVHLMLPRTREFYGLERLWGVDVPTQSSESAQA